MLFSAWVTPHPALPHSASIILILQRPCQSTPSPQAGLTDYSHLQGPAISCYHCLPSVKVSYPVQSADPSSLSSEFLLLQLSHPPGSSERYKMKGSGVWSARNPRTLSSDWAVSWLHIPVFLEALTSGAGLRKRVTDGGSPGILGLEVILCRELLLGRPQGGLNWGLPTGVGSHDEAKCLEPQMLNQQRVLRR